MNKKGGAGLFSFFAALIVMIFFTFIVWVIGSFITWSLWHWSPFIIRLIIAGEVIIAAGTGIIIYYMGE